METKDFGRVLYEKGDDSIARIILNWPERANAQDSEMVWAFDAALKEADKDYDIKLVILKSSGKGFCSGHAMGGEGTFPEFDTERAVRGMNHKASADLFLWPTLYLWEFPKPIIAQVHGYAIGGGSYWALIPDITICSDDAYFQMPLPQGMGFPTGETMIEPWLFMNWKRAAEYMYQSKTLSAQEALEWGAVNQVVPREDLEETVEQMARNIVQAPLTTLMMTKTMLKRAWELMGMRNHMQMGADMISLSSKATDVQAHLQKMQETSGGKPRKMAEKQQQKAGKK